MSKRYLAGPMDDGGYSIWCLEITEDTGHAIVRCSGTAVGTLPISEDDTDEHLTRMLGQFALLLEQVTA